ncbi:MAG: VCBS repeat-containing protein [Blastocatellia bacterium]|nr:VCBS repeat-containing protein [Blastocatellia bacterium]
MKENTCSRRAISKQRKPFAVTVWRIIVTGLLISAVVYLVLPISKRAGAAAQSNYRKVSLSVGGSPAAAKIGDLDGDGRNDIAVVDLQGNLQLFFGDGAGSFDQVSLNGLAPSSSSALDLDIGDLNGDGRNDIAVAFSSQTGAVSVLFNQDNRSFSAPVNYNTCNSSKGVAIGDLNQDGNNDLADISQCNEASVLLNNGQGRFAFNGSYGNGYAARSIALADFNRDGFKDIAYLNDGAGGNSNVTVLLNNGNGTFGAAQFNWVWDNSDDLAVGDFDGDGNLDIATVNSYYALVFVLIGDGHGNFTSYSELYGGEAPTGIKTADFNGDGRLDFAVISRVANSLSIFLNQGYYLYSDPITFSVGQSPVNIAAGNLDGDSLPDLVVVNQGSGSITVLCSSGGAPPPAAPTSLSAIATSSSQVNLTWADNSDDEDGFMIERCQGVGCSNFSEIARVGSNAVGFSNAGLAGGASYSYRVQSFNSGGESDSSNTASATTPAPSGSPAAPSNLRMTAISYFRIDLAWDDKSNNETMFELERCAGATCANFAKIAQPAANAASYSNTDLSRKTAYQYRIRACNGSACSNYSNIVSGTTR